MPTPNDYLTPVQFAALVHMSPETVRVWRRSGRGPRFLRIGRRILYERSAVDEWIAETAKAAA